MKPEDLRACYLIKRTFDKGECTVADEKAVVFHQWIVLDEPIGGAEDRQRVLYAVVEDAQGYVSIVEHTNIRFAHTPIQLLL